MNEFRLSKADTWLSQGSRPMERRGSVRAAVTGRHPDFCLIITEKQAEAPGGSSPGCRAEEHDVSLAAGEEAGGGDEQGRACWRTKEWVKPRKPSRQDVPLEPEPAAGGQTGSFPAAQRGEAGAGPGRAGLPPPGTATRWKGKIKLIKVKTGECH